MCIAKGNMWVIVNCDYVLFEVTRDCKVCNTGTLKQVGQVNIEKISYIFSAKRDSTVLYL